MPIALEVTWNHANQPLLADPAVAVFIEYPTDTPQQPPPVKTTLKSGGFRFEIPGEPSAVELKAGFHFALASATIKQRRWPGWPRPRVVMADTTAPSVSTTLLDASQKYQVRDGKLLAIAQARRFGTSSHPLLSTAGVSVGGVIPVKVHSDFVDVTELWMNRAIDAERYTILHQAETKLVVLGFPDPAGPLVWFAVVPDICQKESKVSCVVFFRPTALHEYTSLDDRRLDMHPLSRYLISPRATLEVPEEDAWAFDRFFPFFPEGAVKPDVFRDLCAGMERALVASGKRAIVLIPWPSGANFGIAPNVKLPGLVAKALRLLWSKGLVAKRASKVELKGLCLAGFSSGSGQLFLSLARNRAAVSEVLGFDCDRMNQFAEQARTWAKESDKRLRMTGGNDKVIEATHAIRNQLVTEDMKNPDHVTAEPGDSTTDWDVGSNPWWDHVTSAGDQATVAAAHISRPLRHQFAMFGGKDPARRETWFAEFLRRSAL